MVNPKSSITRAVVIGISDYREPLIPDLRFADRDAEAFTQWLRAPAGLALPDSNIVFLKNAKATNAQMIVALDWLIEASKPGDRAFIYFSGHGDVENVTKFKRGFLLGYDSPPAVYGAGAFSLSYLQDILSSLAQNEVQVFVITDACRAGKLAGNSIGGAQVTATQLSQQFANEIKVLSCQPDEFSLEGEQWGGGRGCFSYHLEDALYGFADANADESVDLFELRRYLEDHVSVEASPQSQVPMVLGPMKTAIATPQNETVAARKAEKSGKPVPFLDIENRGLESAFLTKSDSSLRQLYEKFLVAVDSGRLLSPPGNCADDFFKQLERRPEMAALRGSMKRRLAAALIEEGQTIVNKVLQTDPQVLDNIWANRVNYDHLPAYFERAAEILGEKHYIWRDLKAKEFYFRAMTVRMENYPDSSAEWITKEKQQLLQRALDVDSTMAVAQWSLGGTYPAYSKERLNCYQRAVNLVSNWALLHCFLGINSQDPTTAIRYFKKAMELDSNYLTPYSWIAWPYFDQGQTDSSTYWWRLYVEKFIQKLEKDSASLTAYECNNVGNALWMLKDYARAIDFLELGIKISRGKYFPVYGNLACVYTDLLEFERAVQASEQAWNLYGWHESNGDLGTIYFNFLYDNNKAIAAYSRGRDVVLYQQVQAWFQLDKAKAFDLASQGFSSADLDPGFGQLSSMMAYYAGEAARLIGQSDSAANFFNWILQQPDIPVRRSQAVMPHYLFVALAYDRLGRKEALQTYMEAIINELAGDPWLYFNLARFYANTVQEQAAIVSLQKAIELGWQPNPLIWLEGTLCDPLLNPIRESEAYKDLVRKHFPKYYDIATRVPGK
ncbi:MAG: caspase family protein [Lewinellaceae bacterium]|nr:caspase family protein [Lewinellaceae bacterium]